MSSSDKPTRREFIVSTSTAALGAAVPLVANPEIAPTADVQSQHVAEAIPYSSEELLPPGRSALSWETEQRKLRCRSAALEQDASV